MRTVNPTCPMSPRPVCLPQSHHVLYPFLNLRWSPWASSSASPYPWSFSTSCSCAALFTGRSRPCPPSHCLSPCPGGPGAHINQAGRVGLAVQVDGHFSLGHPGGSSLMPGWGGVYGGEIHHQEGAGMGSSQPSPASSLLGTWQPDCWTFITAGLKLGNLRAGSTCENAAEVGNFTRKSVKIFFRSMDSFNVAALLKCQINSLCCRCLYTVYVDIRQARGVVANFRPGEEEVGGKAGKAGEQVDLRVRL